MEDGRGPARLAASEKPGVFAYGHSRTASLKANEMRRV
jgi:hypothetical protein